jgi:hypothetical protein
MEASGAARDLQGVPIMRVPAQLLSEDASPNQKIILENLKNILRNLQANSQSGVMLPSATDENSKQHLFDLSLLSTEGGKKNFDLDKIKTYYQNQIYTGLSADVLIMGQGSGGSYNLATVKNTITGAAVEAMMDNLVETFNRDVIRHLMALNGWSVSRAPTLDYENLHDSDLEGLSKAYQRLGATGYLPRTLDVVNRGMLALGIDPLPESTTQEELDELLPDKTTRSGEGMEEGLPSGVGQATGESGNASDLNADNSA